MIALKPTTYHCLLIQTGLLFSLMWLRDTYSITEKSLMLLRDLYNRNLIIGQLYIVQ